jgi:hypothetical protein
MGYTTEFKGELKFTRELKGSELAKLKTILGEDCREHPDWKTKNLYYIDLELTDNFDGLQHDGAEKTYEMVELVNTVIKVMRETVPDFNLTGQLHAQGEDFDDRWTLEMVNGKATKRKIALTGKIIECPHCEEKFELEE